MKDIKPRYAGKATCFNCDIRFEPHLSSYGMFCSISCDRDYKLAYGSRITQFRHDMPYRGYLRHFEKLRKQACKGVMRAMKELKGMGFSMVWDKVERKEVYF